MKYDDEFKRQTVQKVLDGQSVRSVSRELGVTESQIHKWRRDALDNGDGVKSSAELAETAALKKRIREQEQERDILKKCMAPPPESTVERINLASGGTDAANVSGFCFVKAPAFEP